MILGLDVSTSCVGWGVLASNEELIEHGYVKFKPTEQLDLLDKAERLRYTLIALKARYKIEVVGVEDYLEKITPGKSSAHTICLLAGFNNMVQLVIKEVFGFKPLMIKFSEARFALEIFKEKTEKGKEAAFRYITKIYDNFIIEYNRNNKVRDESMDSSDGIVIAKYITRIGEENVKQKQSRTPKKKTRRLQKNRN